MREQLFIDVIGGSTRQFESKLKGLQTLMKGIGLIGLGSFLKDSSKAYELQMTNEAKLDAAIENKKKNLMDIANTSAGISKHFKNQASALQKQTTFGDEVLLQAQENYMTFGLQGKEIDNAVLATANLTAHTRGAHASSQDMLATSNAIGKAITNSAAFLKKNGTLTAEEADNLDKIKDRHQKTLAIMNAINKSYGGEAHRIAMTDAGKLVQAQGRWGDFMEHVGAKVDKILVKLIPFFDQMLEFTDKNLDNIVKIGEALALWKISTMFLTGLSRANMLLNTMGASTTVGGGSIPGQAGSVGSLPNGIGSRLADRLARRQALGNTLKTGAMTNAISLATGRKGFLGDTLEAVQNGFMGARAASATGPWGMAGAGLLASSGALFHLFQDFQEQSKMDGKKVAERQTALHKKGTGTHHVIK